MPVLNNAKNVLLGTQSLSRIKLGATDVWEWSPEALFLSGQQGVWYEPKPEYLFQDAEGTIAVTADGDPVGYMADLSGNGHHATQATSAARPIYRTDGALHWLEFDGVDDWLPTELIDFSPYQKALVCAAIAIPTNVVSGANVLFEFSDLLQNGGIVTHLNYQSGFVSSGIRANDTNNIVGYSRASGQHVISSLVDYSATDRYEQVVMREDGAQKSLSSQQGEAVQPRHLGNYRAHIGARNKSSNPSNFNFYGLAFVSEHTGVNETEAYLANLAGVTL